jgi:hypothetical protein
MDRFENGGAELIFLRQSVVVITTNEYAKKREAVMAFKDEQRAIGREGIIQSNGLEISVIIRSVRPKPEAVDYLIEPTAGRGMTWIDGHQVKIVGWSE